LPPIGVSSALRVWIDGMWLVRISRAVVLLLFLLVLAACATPVRVDWTTESESNTAGFNLYRGESPEGPFPVKVNEQIIPPSPDPLLGGDYRFIDKSAKPGVTYYYQLQEVEKSGAVNVYGPVEVRAAGLGWRHAALLLLLVGGVIVLWLFPKPTRPPTS